MNSKKLQRNQIEKLMGLSTGWRRPAGIFLMVLATLSGLMSLWLFPQSGRINAAWVLYFWSVVLFAIALFCLFREQEKSAYQLFSIWMIGLAGSIILILAIFMRLHLFSSIPFGIWFDEADIGLNAMNIIDGTGELPIFYDFQAQPVHYTYLVSLFIRLFPPTSMSLRVVPVIFGLLSVGAAFLLGNEIRSPRFGLILAFFFAVARWHVTFSRLGFATITNPFFVLITLLFLFRAMRTKKPLDFGLGGIALGLGFDFQLAFRVVPIALIPLFVYWSIRIWRESSISSSPRILWTINLAVFLLAIGLAVAPVVQYALREPEIFWARTRTVSIFQTRDEPDIKRAIASNALDHLLMFNYQGDKNGRHNLPGEPMLDPISGVLFVLGLGLALSRVKQPVEFSFLVLFVVGLSAGIFSVDFESPQAQRSVTAMPAVFFFISLAVDSLWNRFQQSGISQNRRIFLIGSIVVAGFVVTYLNAHTYFVRQANNPRVWNEHNAAETLTGNALRELNSDETTVYLSMFLHNHRVIQFLAPNFGETKLILPPDVVPLRESGDKSIVLFIDQEQEWVVDLVKGLYPRSNHAVFSDPVGNPILHKILVTPNGIKSVQGLTVQYRENNKLEGPVISRIDRTLEAEWPMDSPISAPFTAEWEGVLYVPQFDEYQFQIESPGEATIWLNEQLILHKDSNTHPVINNTLYQGNHSLKVQAIGGEGIVQLAWRRNLDEDFVTIPPEALYLSPPVYSNGLVGSYYQGGNWDSRPSNIRIDPFIDMYIHLIPLERPYGVEWEGEIEIPTTGEYEFGLRVNGQAKLFINNELLVDASQPTEYLGETISLSEGRNKLRLRFLDYLGGSRIHLYWTKPGDTRTIVPTMVLFPSP